MNRDNLEHGWIGTEDREGYCEKKCTCDWCGEPIFEGEEGNTAYLNNAGRAMETFGYPEVSAETLIRWQAEYILSGSRTLDKPTHFEERKGSY